MIPASSSQGPAGGLESIFQSIGQPGGSSAGAAAQLGALPTASTPSGGTGSAASAVSQLGAGSIYDQISRNYETKQLGLNAPVSSQDIGQLMSGQNITAGGQSVGLNSPVDAAQAKAMGFSPDVVGSGANLQGYLVGQSAFDAFAGINPDHPYTGLTTQYISEISKALQKAYPQLASQQTAAPAASAAPAAQPVGVGSWGVIP